MKRRWLPDTLFARLMWAFAGGLTLTALVSVAVQLPARDAWVFRLTAAPAARRVAEFVRAAERLPLEQRTAFSALATGQGLRTSFGPAPGAGGTATTAEAGTFGAMVADQIGSGYPLAVAVRRTHLDAPVPGANGRATTDGYAFDVATQLADGTGLRIEFTEPRFVSRWPYRTLNNLLLMLGVVAVSSVIAVRWVTRPLAQLAGAAEALGRDMQRPPLDESGPQEVRRAARAFNVMQERLARYVRTRTSILAAMSHDLKTPVTRLKLRAELLDDPAVRDKFVRDLEELERMVQLTLDYMRGLDDGEALRPVDVDALLSAMVADEEASGHDMRLSGSAGAPFMGKPAGLRRLLQNLIDNAIKYGSDVEVAVGGASDKLAITVLDRGPGIPADALEQVFEPFRRLEASRHPDTGGPGLGLSIARNIAQAMGGDVTLSNRVGGGLEARLRLPRR